MGIIFKVLEEGETVMCLSEHSIKHIDFQADLDVLGGSFNNDNIRELHLRGDINPQDRGPCHIVGTEENEDGEEVDIILSELDSVRQLMNWALIPEFDKCYKAIEVEIIDSGTRPVQEESYEDMYIVKFHEDYDDDRGHGEFRVVFREKKA